ncbi:MAG: hypothetical protein ACTS6G_02110 [Candidatus Hodgkinia cicadicola]
MREIVPYKRDIRRYTSKDKDISEKSYIGKRKRDIARSIEKGKGKRRKRKKGREKERRRRKKKEKKRKGKKEKKRKKRERERRRGGRKEGR